MLPLLSISSPMETGMSSPLKTVMGCFLPFSNTANALRSRVVTNSPRLFLTVTCRTTSRVSARNGGGCCARGAAVTASANASATATFTVRTYCEGPGARRTSIGVFTGKTTSRPLPRTLVYVVLTAP